MLFSREYFEGIYTTWSFFMKKHDHLRFEQNTMEKNKKKTVESSSKFLQNDIFPIDIFPSFLGI